MNAPLLPRSPWPLGGILGLVLAGCATSATKAPSMPPTQQAPATPSIPRNEGEASQKAETPEKAGAPAGRDATVVGTARTADEERDALDGQLQASMAEFDGMLLKEQKALEDKQRKDPLPDRGGESAGGSAGGGEKGQAGGEGGKDDRTAAEKRADAEAEAAEKRAKAEVTGETRPSGAAPADAGTGGSTDAGRHEGGTPVTAPVEGGPADPGSDRSAVPADVGDGKDDDVVARQLREAATKEKDPAIREKLWEEYREYRKGTGKGGS
jgi:hypothetical protein